MKRKITKLLFFSAIMISAMSAIAQATPGNAGVSPGSSNGGSGIETQPTVNPNTLVKPAKIVIPTEPTEYTGPTGPTGPSGSSGTYFGITGTCGPHPCKDTFATQSTIGVTGPTGKP